MELGLLVIFMVGGSWLYASALLALADWRWNLGRVVAFGFLGGLSIWPALNGPEDAQWLVGLGGLFCLTVVAPHFLSKKIKSLTLAGDIHQALRLELFNALLTFQSVDAGRSRLREAHRIIRHDWSGVGAAAKEEWLHRIRNDSYRRRPAAPRQKAVSAAGSVT